jgi:hypothetical protein
LVPQSEINARSRSLRIVGRLGTGHGFDEPPAIPCQEHVSLDDTHTAERDGALVVKNYTGDRLNFGLAAEMVRAEVFRSKW